MSLVRGVAREDIARMKRLLHGDEDADSLRVENRSTPSKALKIPQTALAGLAARAGVPFERAATLRRTGMVFAALIALTAILSNRGILLILIVLPLRLARWRLRTLAENRAEVFERDYPAFLLSLSSAVRTGQDPLAAFCTVHRLLDPASEVYREVEKTKQELEAGVQEEEAIGRFASSVDHPDVALFNLAFILSRKHGSSLSPCLKRLVKVTRQRQSFRRKLAAAVAMQKLSAIGIACCACAITGIQALGNPAALQQAANSPVGVKGLTAGALLMLSGLVWMFQLTRRRI